MTTCHVFDEGREVLLPVHEQVKKFIQPGNNRGYSKTEVQDLIGLVARFRRANAFRVE
jgi:hypothetical protein